MILVSAIVAMILIGGFVKDFVSLACLILSILIGLPCAALGMAGLAGFVADAEYAVSIRFALPYLAVSSIVLLPSTVWFF